MEDWDGAFKIYQTILVHHRDSQKESEIVDIFYRLGIIKLKQGERKKALNMFEKALEIEAAHRADAAGGHRAAGAGGRLGGGRSTPSARCCRSPRSRRRSSCSTRSATSTTSKLQNPQKAITAYLEALEVRPGNHVILHKVLDLYSETKQWKKAVEIIERIADLEKDPIRRASTTTPPRASCATR